MLTGDSNHLALHLWWITNPPPGPAGTELVIQRPRQLSSGQLVVHLSEGQAFWTTTDAPPLTISESVRLFTLTLRRTTYIH